jgi:CBS domain-containing protein
MTQKVLTSHEESPICEAAQLMLDHKLACLAVVQGQHRSWHSACV